MNQDDKSVAIGDVVQLNPDTVSNKMLSGCFLVVDKVKAWGVRGYIQAPGENGKPGGQIYYRAPWKEFEQVGEAAWFIPD